MSKSGIFSIIVLIILLMVGVILMSKSGRRYGYAKNIRRQYGIPDGMITYSDLNKPAQPLFSKELGLTGKPDYIVRHRGQYIPVEVKTGTAIKPYWNHIMQIAAYCLLLEEQYNTAVPFGVLTYGDRRQFRVPFGPELKRQIQDKMAEIRAQLWSNQVDRNHNVATKCQSCSLRRYCTQKIV
jgi:CRISPR-associated exonuclease Cas4